LCTFNKNWLQTFKNISTVQKFKNISTKNGFKNTKTDKQKMALNCAKIQKQINFQ